MSSRHSREPANTMHLGVLPDAEGNQDLPKQSNDLRLTQALNYLAKEGGDDSPDTYISRVNRINEALVQPLPQSGQDYDLSLYLRVRAMVQRVQQAHENPTPDRDVSVLHRSGDDMLQTPMNPQFPEVHNKELPQPVPQIQPPNTLPTRAPPVQIRVRKNLQDNVERERKHVYGGPDSEPEYWYRDMPSSLPFPDNFRMAHWESLKIDFDISEAGKALKAKGKVVETNVSFNHDQLKQYNNLNQYDSGSRFKLPDIHPNDLTAVHKLASRKLLQSALDEFNHGNRSEEKAKNYAPHVFLPKFSIYKNVVEKRSLPTAIRESLGTSPTKSRMPATASVLDDRSNTNQAKVSEANSKFEREKRAALRENRKRSRSSQHPRLSNLDLGPDNTDAPVYKKPKISSMHSHSNNPVPDARSVAAMRNVETQRDDALSSSPRESSGAGTKPASHAPKPSIARATHVVIPAKRPRGRPRKNPQPESTTPGPANPSGSSKRRKHSLPGEQYTPHIPSNRRAKTPTSKNVEFVDISSTAGFSDSSDYMDEGASAGSR